MDAHGWRAGKGSGPLRCGSGSRSGSQSPRPLATIFERARTCDEAVPTQKDAPMADGRSPRDAWVKRSADGAGRRADAGHHKPPTSADECRWICSAANHALTGCNALSGTDRTCVDAHWIDSLKAVARVRIPSGATVGATTSTDAGYLRGGHVSTAPRLLGRVDARRGRSAMASAARLSVARNRCLWSRSTGYTSRAGAKKPGLSPSGLARFSGSCCGCRTWPGHKTTYITQTG